MFMIPGQYNSCAYSLLGIAMMAPSVGVSHTVLPYHKHSHVAIHHMYTMQTQRDE